MEKRTVTSVLLMSALFVHRQKAVERRVGNLGNNASALKTKHTGSPRSVHCIPDKMERVRGFVLLIPKRSLEKHVSLGSSNDKCATIIPQETPSLKVCICANTAHIRNLKNNKYTLDLGYNSVLYLIRQVIVEVMEKCMCPPSS